MKTRPEVTIHDLLGMGPDQLLELYRAARTPAIADRDGRLQGRMLAVPRAQTPHVSRWLRRLAGTLWQGKTFEHHDSMHGEGVNRVLGEKLNWFPVRIRIIDKNRNMIDSVLDEATID